MQTFLQPLFRHQTYQSNNFFLLAGPCVIESETLLMEVAEKVYGICQKLGIPYVFKSSYRKANRTSANSFTGIGDEAALKLLKKVRDQFGIPVVTDIHLLEAAARTGKIVNVKKGQFVSGPAMKFAVEKIKNAGNEQVLLTERGNSFGYTDLVVDYRNIPWMQEYAPVVMDCTHSLQQPNQTSGITGGNPQLIGTMAKAAIATGADGLFIETHPQPSQAKSDGANMLRLDLIEGVLNTDDGRGWCFVQI